MRNGERDLKKNDGILCSRNDMKYSCLTQHKNTASISLQCQVLGVNRSVDDHYRANRANNIVGIVHQKMVEWLKGIAKHSLDSDGSRRMRKALTVRGYSVTRAKARTLMREVGGQVRYRKKFKVTTNS